MILNYFILTFVIIALRLQITKSDSLHDLWKLKDSPVVKDIKEDKQLKYSTIKEYPYFCSIEFNKILRCSCSIVSQNNVLTAAHCVNGLEKNDLIIRVGTDKIGNGGDEHAVEDVIVHPEFAVKNIQHSPKIYNNDIAIIRVKNSFDLKNENIGTADLYNTTEKLKADHAIVVGYGVGGVGLGNLKSYHDIFFDFGETACIAMFKNRVPFLPSQICAGFISTKGKKIASQEDAGAPLLLGKRLVGILSYLKSYNSYPIEPEIYSSVPAFRPWMDQYIIY